MKSLKALTIKSNISYKKKILWFKINLRRTQLISRLFLFYKIDLNKPNKLCSKKNNNNK